MRERRPQPRALSEVERDTVRALLNSPDFVDKAPATVYHELLDEGVYVASVSSMYRVLREHGEVGERRRQAVHPARAKPELVATAPNTVWSWAGSRGTRSPRPPQAPGCRSGRPPTRSLLGRAFSDGPPPNRTCPLSVASGSPVLIVYAVWDVRRGCPHGRRGKQQGFCGGGRPSAWPIQVGVYAPWG